MARNRRQVGARLREIRDRNNWTLRQVGSWTGINYATLSKIENGDRVATEDHISRIIENLHVSAKWLLGSKS